MMIRSQKTYPGRQYRRGATGHATVLPKPAPDRSDQRQAKMKAEMVTSDDTGQDLTTIKSIIMAVLNLNKSTSQHSNPHSSNKPFNRA